MKRTCMKENLSNRQTTGRASASCTQSGFTLLETAIAFSIMLIVALATTGLFLYANGYNSGAADRALAISVAKQQMEQLRNVAFDDSLLSATSGVDTTVSDGGKNYTVTKKVENMTACTGCNAAKKITITVTPQDRSPIWGATPVTVVGIRSDNTTGPYFN